MLKTELYKFAFGAVYYSGLARFFSPVWGGRGVIFCLHHVKKEGVERIGFAPNSNLEITPEFLDALITLVKRQGYELLSLDAACERLKAGQGGNRFAVFTLDDGYKDNLEHAMPVFERHQCPFTVYVAPRIADGLCELWWRDLEAVIAKVDQLSVIFDGHQVSSETTTVAGKVAAWKAIAPRLQAMPEYAQRDWISA